MTRKKAFDKWLPVMPPKHTRVLYITPDDILSGIVSWGIKQSPFDFPDNIPLLLPKLAGMLKLKFATMGAKELGGVKMWKVTYDNLHTYLVELMYKVKELQDWNISKIDRDKGISINDDRTSFQGKSIDDPTPVEYDFIDLDAVARNVANELYKDNIFVHDDVTHRRALDSTKLGDKF